MKNTIDDLRNHLFETLEALRDKDDPLDLERAKAVANVSGRIIDTAKVELKFIELTGKEGSGFVDPEKRPRLQSGHRPKLVK